MKRRVSTAEYDALPDALKAVYTADGDSFKLNLSDDDDPDALRRARDREKQENKDARKRVAELEAELDKLTTDPARKAGDIKTLEASWAKKLTDSETASGARIAALTKHIETSLVTGEVAKIAGGITKPEHSFILEPHIRGRVKIEWNGEEPTVRILDKDGKPSAMNAADLQKEFSGDARFASLVVGSKASGAGGNGGPGSTPVAVDRSKKFGDFTDAERIELHRTDPEGFSRMVAEHKSASFA